MRPVLAPYEDMESKLKEWVLDLRDNGYVVTRPSIRVQALQIADLQKALRLLWKSSSCDHIYLSS